LRTGHQDRDTLSVHTLEEAATILRVKESWLERQAAARKIPFTMLGGSYHFTAAHLAAIVRIHEKSPSAETGKRTSRPASHSPRAHEVGRPQTLAPLRPRPRTGAG
jgi:excisionase family DNA binding protein